MPTCKICETIFPNLVNINGEKKNLQRRKYCLLCSPYGKHNTKQLHVTTIGKNTKHLISLEKWNWISIQKFYDDGNSLKKCMNTFSISVTVIYEAKKFGYFMTRPAKTFDLFEHLKEDSYPDRKRFKKELIRSGLLENKCDNCKIIPFWDEKPLVFVLDHKNGINTDNRLENVRFLCPNCNSQTETFCVGGRKRKPSIRAKDLIHALKSTESIKEALTELGMQFNGNSYSRVLRLLNVKSLLLEP
jgi:hypothetical protein